MSRASKLLGESKKRRKNEEFDAKAAINDLIKTEFSKSDDDKGKAAELLKGLFFSEEPEAKKLIADLDKWFSSLEVSEEEEDDEEEKEKDVEEEDEEDDEEEKEKEKVEKKKCRR